MQKTRARMRHLQFIQHQVRADTVQRATGRAGALSYSDAGAGFLDVPALRLEQDSQSSKATEQLFAALDVCLKSSA